jgi:TonB family protein
MSRHLHWPLLLLAATLFFTLAAPAFPQAAELDALAADFAKKLSKPEWQLTGEVRAAVVSFQGPQGENSQLGARLSSLFVEAVRRQGINLILVDRETFARYREQKRWSPIDPWDLTVARNMARESGAKLFIVGVFGKGKDRVDLRVEATLLAMEKVIAKSHAKILLSAALRPLASLPIAAPPAPSPGASSTVAPSQTIYHPGQNGVTFPQCSKCPDPSFTQEARDAKYSGRVLLVITITPKGGVGDIHVLQGDVYGLGEAAKQAVVRWKFKPARNRDGQPVPVQVHIEVIFRLMP